MAHCGACGADLAKKVGLIKAGDAVVLAHGSKATAAAEKGSLTSFMMSTIA